ncbi:DUF2281 domain-containing protein [Halomonas sp. DQ26W]|uniref:DUF2281 domain-containing protein n=1 Tax=Halomonas sp. DQ26W TaxID=2282311 RepID=UPI000DF7FD88|nr:DUF2281 domain-containing protein [Halomonas sp. DQ26W]RDB41846.1 DUF2281 domain-containing protein [Halomonas sp. DQ26W]
MQLEELIQRVSRLPPDRQEEVMDFIAFLEHRYGQCRNQGQEDWTNHEFQTMSLDQAMRGQEGEPDLYTEADLKERWQ